MSEQVAISEQRAALESYLRAFETTSDAERIALLASCVTDDLSFSNPGVEGSGRDQLLSHIAAFRQKFPGGRFRLNWFRHQNRQALIEWTQIDGDGVESVTGHAYALFDDDSKIVKWAGFWEIGSVQEVYPEVRER